MGWWVTGSMVMETAMGIVPIGMVSMGTVPTGTVSTAIVSMGMVLMTTVSMGMVLTGAMLMRGSMGLISAKMRVMTS